MNNSKQRSGVLIIGDTGEFAQVIQTAIGNIPGARPVRCTTYENFRGIVTSRIIRETKLFVLELWRSYPTGWRAEGIAVAEQLIRLGAKSTIVSPLALGATVDDTVYWDSYSKKSLTDHFTAALTQESGFSDTKSALNQLRAVLIDYSGKPVGHPT